MTALPKPAPPFADVTLAMISWKAPRTLAATIKTFEDAGILELFADLIIHFNEISADDRRIAAAAGFRVSESASNIGIFGSVEAVTAQVGTPFVLSLENDCPLIATRAQFIAMMSSALDDMRTLDIPVFSMRSRREPGMMFDRGTRYARRFRLVWPLGAPPDQRGPATGLVQRLYEDRRRPSLRGSAIYAEEDPTLRHPAIISRTANGNWVTRAPYLSWSNNGILVRTEFLRGVVLDRVRRFPAKATLNGFQDIEAALKEGGWWGRQAFLMGQSEPGPFTHLRLDR